MERHLDCALRVGTSVVREVKAGRICLAEQLAGAIVPVYGRMNLAWHGCCCTRVKDLRTIPALTFEWSQMPVDLWNSDPIVAGRYGMVKLQKRTDRRIPLFLRVSVIADLAEGIGGLRGIVGDTDNLGRTRVSLAHSYRHLNWAVNSAFEMTAKEFRLFSSRDDEGMRVFYDYSRWPEAIVRELGPEWVVELQQNLVV
jgi:hypothetical protein